MTMVSIQEPLKALYNPFEGVGPAVTGRRWVWPLLLLMATVIFAGVVFALRWDPTGQVLSELGEAAAKTSEADLAQAIQTKERITLILGVVTGLFGAPLAVLAFAGVTRLILWLLAKRTTFGAVLSAVTIALLPFALFKLLWGIAALAHFSVTPEQVPTLLPTNLGALLHPHSAKLLRLLPAFDFFSLWAVGLGLSAAASVGRLRGLLMALGLYAAYVAIFILGLPGLAGGAS